MAGISQESKPADCFRCWLAMHSSTATKWGRRRNTWCWKTGMCIRRGELQPLAVSDGQIHVTGCGDVGPLIQVLGYQFENGCGHDRRNADHRQCGARISHSRLRVPADQARTVAATGTPFTYAYPATRIPILFHEDDWLSLLPAKDRAGATLLDLLLNDQNADRLYAAMSRLDPETRHALFQSPGLKRLLFYAPVLDFYGSRLCVRSGAVVLPGGDAAAPAWESLVGVSPQSPGEFVIRLLAKDQGWLAAYFDAVARVSPEQQARLTQGDRLKGLYEAYRSGVPERRCGKQRFHKELRTDSAADALAMGCSRPAARSGQPRRLAGGVRARE